MADILIRDVDIPIDCRSCWMRGYCYERGMGIWGYGKGKPCPLVPLPEGHGELIDKAEAYDRIAEQEGGNHIDMDSVGMGLEECQVVVPAEGGNIDGN